MTTDMSGQRGDRSRQMGVYYASAEVIRKLHSMARLPDSRIREAEGYMRQEIVTYTSGSKASALKSRSCP